MLDEHSLRGILQDLESDRVDRTVSTNDTDKFCEAICAFSNDMPGNGSPGYLIIGANNDGSTAGIEITDQLLQQLSNYADSGQIVPLPTMAVAKMSMDGADLAVAEVQPSDMPPVRYKGRVCIRRGPRKAVANEQEERILTERRRHRAKSFDLRPCIGCGQDEITFDLFQLTYRHAAVDPEIIEANDRNLLLQMASLGFWDTERECATNGGVILFGQDPCRWFPGAYIQYVQYDGEELDAEVLSERRFDGDLISLLRALDKSLDTLVPATPVPDSALRERQRSVYPVIALRELLMNAVMHRDYESNAPIRFYQFRNRIEIQNPGGLYGSVTPETFPNQNDYRNPKISEAMKTLGYVNNFGRGIARAQGALRENGNPPAEFIVDQSTFFLVKISGLHP